MVSSFVRIYDYALFAQFFCKRRQVFKSFRMYDKAVECIAYAHPARFGIENYIFTFFSIAMDVEISVAYACAGFYDRYPGIVADVFYKTFSAAWYQKVNISDGIQQFGQSPAGRKEAM